MAKIHIALVGGQTAPVYLGIVDANPDKVVLIYSNQTEEEANRIYAQLNVDCELKKFDPVDLNKIENSISALIKQLKTTDLVSINLGGGTKPWSILFYEHFKSMENTFLFFMDQNNLVWDLKTHAKHEVAFDMDMQFKLYGNPLTDYKKFTDYTADDKNLIVQIRKIREFNYQDFNFITEYLYRYPHETSKESSGGSSIHWLPTEKAFRCSMKNKKGKELNLTLKSEHARSLLLNTGWFEFEIAQILSNWKFTKEIRLNCLFPAASSSPKNEIDIIINTGTKLLFVECKTQIKNETDIDKFASAVKVYGGLGSKALFITDITMSDKAREKCADHGIMTFSLDVNIFNFPLDKMIFAMLESELFNINAK